MTDTRWVPITRTVEGDDEEGTAYYWYSLAGLEIKAGVGEAAFNAAPEGIEVWRCKGHFSMQSEASRPCRDCTKGTWFPDPKEPS